MTIMAMASLFHRTHCIHRIQITSKRLLTIKKVEKRRAPTAEIHIKTNKQLRTQIDNNRNVPKCKRSLYFLSFSICVCDFVCNIKCANILSSSRLYFPLWLYLSMCVCVYNYMKNETPTTMSNEVEELKKCEAFFLC